MENLDVVVVGAGIAGLGASLALSRAGHKVTIIERDDSPMPSDVEGAFEWERRGVPQTRHPHVFLGLARTILRDRYPDVLDVLRDEGVHEVTMGANSPMPLPEEVVAVLEADDDLKMLATRRTTFEWVLRRVVMAEPNVTLELGTGVAGLIGGEPSDSGLPTVVGVVLEDGTERRGDLVVASSGRRGAIKDWLAPFDVEIPEEESDAGVVYFSRFYRTPDDEEFGFRGGFGSGLVCGVIGADAGTYSVTAIVDKNDKELRAHLTDSERFEATIALLPELADVTAAAGEPIHPVHCMTGLVNRRREFTTSEGTPRVVGLVASGDVHTCTNPAYGRGMSLGLLMGTLIADAIATNDDLENMAIRYEADCEEHVAPWYRFSVFSDQMRAASAGSLAEAETNPGARRDPFSQMFSGAMEPEMVRTAMRVLNLLDSPDKLLALLPAIQKAAAEPTKREPRPDRPRRHRPTRDELLAVGA